MSQIDVRGKPCPQPVLMTKEAVDRGEDRVEVLLDNEGSAQNVLRFIRNAGYDGEISGDGAVWVVHARRTGAKPVEKPLSASCVTCAVDNGAPLQTLIIQAEYLGVGDKKLGARLLKQFLNTLAVSERRPKHIVLMNTGARLACTGSPVLEPLRDLAGKGATVLVCGTCLNHFGLNKELAVGRPTDAYEVLNLTLDGGVTTWG